LPYLGAFEQLILFSVLQLEDGAYGVSIRENIEERTGRTVSIGAIYTTLGRLEERGLVRSRTLSRSASGSRWAWAGDGCS
jgi:DNA-binding PadR family transcriptional regulator